MRFNFDFVARNLPPGDVGPLMYERGLLTDNEYEYYRSMRDSGKPEHYRSEYLLESLMKREAGFLGKFCDILQGIKGAEHIAECLTTEEVEGFFLFINCS